MKKLIFFTSIVLFTTSCSMRDLNVAERNTVSDNGSVDFKELFFFLNIKLSDGSYMAVKSIDSVNIFVNKFHWATVNSTEIDISKISTTLEGNKYKTDQKLNYLVTAKQQQKEIKYTTAGDFSAYLNKLTLLTPRQYACLIKSFQVTLADNTVKTYYPYQYTVFSVEQNSANAFLGEIEVMIKN